MRHALWAPSVLQVQQQCCAQLASLATPPCAPQQPAAASALLRQASFVALAAQAAQVLAQTPQVTPIADELLKSVGFVDMNGAGVIDPNAVPQMQPMAAPQQQAMPQLQQADGAMRGIETQAADGVVDPTLNQPGV